MQRSARVRAAIRYVRDHPREALQGLSGQGLRALAKYVASPRNEQRLDAPWNETKGLRHRRYGSYDSYVAHQRKKLDTVAWMPMYDSEYRRHLRERLQSVGQVGPGMSVLCLAARLGTEVKAFRDLGCFALGIDLNPGKDNHYVLPGDFHALEFPDNCVDVVFINSLDHALYLDKLIAEMHRVLKPAGLMVLEVDVGTEGGRNSGYYEAAYWDSLEDLLPLFHDKGYAVSHQLDFSFPWTGKHLVLTAKQDFVPSTE